ncbi:MAG: glycosyltransferase [Candidatus Woesebacteria bacterium]|nr:MAG: glycosyltransferase [Candidatus Woesebacteria bacterium]
MITAHVLVKNEGNFIWYSVMSVANFVDRLMLWDTGSTDNTLIITKEIKKQSVLGKKIFLHSLEFKKYDEQKARQMMLQETPDGWFIVVDGDEIWWDDSIKKVTDEIRNNGNNIESIVVPTINLVGDIFHYQEKEAGKYNLLGRKGHYNLRAVNKKIPGLKSLGEHGVWGWVDEDNKMIQERSVSKIKFLDAPYLHATHLKRAGEFQKDSEVLKRSSKLKHELGIEFPKDFYYPEVFFKSRPKIVPNVWENMNFIFKLRSFFETPLRKINRRYMPEKIGY